MAHVSRCVLSAPGRILAGIPFNHPDGCGGSSPGSIGEARAARHPAKVWHRAGEGRLEPSTPPPPPWPPPQTPSPPQGHEGHGLCSWRFPFSWVPVTSGKHVSLLSLRVLHESSVFVLTRWRSSASAARSLHTRKTGTLSPGPPFRPSPSLLSIGLGHPDCPPSVHAPQPSPPSQLPSQDHKVCTGASGV